MEKLDLPFTFLMTVTGLYFAVIVALSHRVKSHHVETWEKLGRFTLILNNSISGGIKFLRYFVFSNSYLELQDGAINALVIAARTFFVCWLLLLVWNALLV